MTPAELVTHLRLCSRSTVVHPTAQEFTEWADVVELAVEMALTSVRDGVIAMAARQARETRWADDPRDNGRDNAFEDAVALINERLGCGPVSLHRPHANGHQNGNGVR